MAQTLEATAIDLKIAKNCEAHNTTKYDCTEQKRSHQKLVCRRGQSFELTITFNKPYVKDEYNVTMKMECQTGKQPLVSQGTLGIMSFDKESFDSDEWGATVQKQDGKKSDVKINIPFDCVVGTWQMVVQTKPKKDQGGETTRYVHKQEVIVLFNAWCPADTVFMDLKGGVDLRDEYVLNDEGVIYRGSHKKMTEKPWNFGQFNDGIVEICLAIVMRALKTNLQMMKDPVTVTRAISRVINLNDKDGVLTDIDLMESDSQSQTTESQERHPSSWPGSVQILEQYWEQNAPVKYGNSTVFAGVTTTVCRALGIPSRPVTNYNSGFDLDGSYTIDTYCKLTEHGIEKAEPGEFSNQSEIVWRHHVWNEVWMRRPEFMDLFDSYDGWQAIDSTLVEPSRGLLQCGPAPVYAIKEGLPHTPYEAGFFFSAVNGDMITWLILEDGSEEKLSLDAHSIGKKVITKNFNGTEPLSLTENYKYAEGTEKERDITTKVVHSGKRAKDAYSSKAMNEDVAFKIRVENEGFGQNATIRVTAKNTADVARTIKKGSIIVRAASLSEKKKWLMKIHSLDLKTIQPGKEVDYSVVMMPHEYKEALSADILMEITAAAFVPEETKSRRPVQYFIKTKKYDFVKPTLDVQLAKDVAVGTVVKVIVKIIGLQNKTLTGCEILCEGGGVKNKQRIKDVTEASSVELALTPTRSGKAMISVCLANKEGMDIGGSAEINVRNK